jgi:hypothetical protein
MSPIAFASIKNYFLGHSAGLSLEIWNKEPNPRLEEVPNDFPFSNFLKQVDGKK